MQEKVTIIGVDVGGSHITAALVCPRTCTVKIESIVRSTVNAEGSASEILDVWLDAIAAVLSKREHSADEIYLAFSMPGPFDYANGISLIKGMNKYENLYGISIRQIFAERFRIPENHILFINDALAFVRGEVLFGAGKTYNRVFGMTLGTGLGTGFHENNVTVDLNFGSSPFLSGISEDYISTRGVLKHYRSVGGKKANDVQQVVSEIQLSDSPPAKNAMRQLSVWLKDFIMQYVINLNPQIIIIGGNITLGHAYFLPTCLELLSDNRVHVPIKLAQMGECAALSGASSYFKLTHRTESYGG
ncbi:hypothetical protein GCM10023231_28870 [Olivibacter ginsenosidimutans]|uniref:ROK family protein n=1 Tax=Olivibacter ginsenosidimutans TaxID=1176537 RepID=A0ABP9BRZ8_9SPHI